MNDKGIETIELTWDYVGPCPEQWYAYFYNVHDNKTYCVYIRQDTYWWSADLIYADGRHSGENFEKLPYEKKKWEYIQLAFDYLSEIVASYNDEDMTSREILEEIIIYLSHKFPYLHFDSQLRGNSIFMEKICKEGKDSRTEVLHRRAKLMRRYLAEYEKYINDIKNHNYELLD